MRCNSHASSPPVTARPLLRTGATAGPHVTATAATLGGDASRTTFRLELSDGVTAEIFTLADPYRVIVDLPDVSFQLPARRRARALRAREGVPLRPVRRAQGAHRHRYDRSGPDRARGHGGRRPGATASSSRSSSSRPRPRASARARAPSAPKRRPSPRRHPRTCRQAKERKARPSS